MRIKPICNVCRVELSYANTSGLCREHARQAAEKRWQKEHDMLKNHPLRKVPLEEIARRFNAKPEHAFDFSATYKRYEEYIAPKAIQTYL